MNEWGGYNKIASIPLSFLICFLISVSCGKDTSRLAMASSNDSNEHLRTFENGSHSYRLDSIPVLELFCLPGLNSDLEQLCCSSCPPKIVPCSKMVSFLSSGVGGDKPPFIADIQCKQCPTSKWSICADCKSCTLKFTNEKQILSHIRQYHSQYFELHNRKRKRRQKSSPHQPLAAIEHPPIAYMESQSVVAIAPIVMDPDDVDVRAAVGIDTEGIDHLDVDTASGLDKEAPPAVTIAGFPILTHPSSI